MAEVVSETKEDGKTAEEVFKEKAEELVKNVYEKMLIALNDNFFKNKFFDNEKQISFLKENYVNLSEKINDIYKDPKGYTQLTLLFSKNLKGVYRTDDLNTLINELTRNTEVSKSAIEYFIPPRIEEKSKELITAKEVLKRFKIKFKGKKYLLKVNNNSVFMEYLFMLVYYYLVRDNKTPEFIERRIKRWFEKIKEVEEELIKEIWGRYTNDKNEFDEIKKEISRLIEKKRRFRRNISVDKQKQEIFKKNKGFLRRLKEEYSLEITLNNINEEINWGLVITNKIESRLIKSFLFPPPLFTKDDITEEVFSTDVLAYDKIYDQLKNYLNEFRVKIKEKYLPVFSRESLKESPVSLIKELLGVEGYEGIKKISKKLENYYNSKEITFEGISTDNIYKYLNRIILGVLIFKEEDEDAINLLVNKKVKYKTDDTENTFEFKETDLEKYVEILKPIAKRFKEQYSGEIKEIKTPATKQTKKVEKKVKKRKEPPAPGNNLLEYDALLMAFLELKRTTTLPLVSGTIKTFITGKEEYQLNLKTTERKKNEKDDGKYTKKVYEKYLKKFKKKDLEIIFLKICCFLSSEGKAKSIIKIQKKLKEKKTSNEYRVILENKKEVLNNKDHIINIILENMEDDEKTIFQEFMKQEKK